MKHLSMPLAGLFLGALSLLAGLGVASGQSNSVVVAVDANPAGNGPNSVGNIEGCVTATGREPLDIDIVVPNPGIPADRGLFGFRFVLEYDPLIVHVTASDPELLVTSAPGGHPLVSQDPLPDTDGTFTSFAADFSANLEAGGSAEAGAGVLARITLLPQAKGTSQLNIIDLQLRDGTFFGSIDAATQSATVAVDEPCDQGADTGGGGPGNGDTGNGNTSDRNASDGSDTAGEDSGPSPDGDDGEPTTTDPGPGQGPTNVLPIGPSGPAGGATTGADPAFPGTGGPPPAGESSSSWIVVAGLIGILGGLSILTASAVAYRRR